VKTILTITLFALAVFFAACTPEEPATPEVTEATETITLTVTGSGSVTPVINAIADQFEADTPGYLLEVLPGSGTGSGVRGIIDGTLDFAAMSRPAREDEEGVVYVPYGTSSTAVFTHPDVGVTELTSEQLTDVFSGEITNWSEVGGNDLEILIFIRDEEEGNTVDLREAFIGDAGFQEGTQPVESQTEMQETVAELEGAIGYGTWAAAVANEADVTPLTVDGIGVDDAPESLQTQQGIGYLEENAELMQPFVDWLFSENGQTALVAAGVVPLETTTDETEAE